MSVTVVDRRSHLHSPYARDMCPGTTLCRSGLQKLFDSFEDRCINLPTSSSPSHNKVLARPQMLTFFCAREIVFSAHFLLGSSVFLLLLGARCVHSTGFNRPSHLSDQYGGVYVVGLERLVGCMRAVVVVVAVQCHDVSMLHKRWYGHFLTCHEQHNSCRALLWIW